MNANYRTCENDRPINEQTSCLSTSCLCRQYELLRWKLLRETERYLNNPQAQPWERQKLTAA